MNGVMGGKFSVTAEDTATFTTLLAEEYVRSRAAGLPCIPIPLVEKRTPFYKLFHDVDVLTPDADYLTSVFYPTKLPLILQAHCELFGLESIDAIVYTSVRRKDDQWKTGIHLYVPRGRRGTDDIDIIVDKDLATMAVLHSRHLLGEPLKPTVTLPSIIDACVHDENGLRIPFVAKSDQVHSCPICFPDPLNDRTAFMHHALPVIRAAARCSSARYWIDCNSNEKSPAEIHKFIASILPHALPTCDDKCDCRWTIWRTANEVRSAHGPCYQGKRLILEGYTPHAEVRFDLATKTSTVSHVDTSNLDIDETARYLRSAFVRSTATAPTVSASSNLPSHAAVMQWFEEKKRKRTKPSGEMDAQPTGMRSSLTTAGLNEALQDMAQDDRFKQRFPRYAAAMGAVSASHVGEHPSPVMLVWNFHSDLPCPVANKPHRSNRPYMLISGKTCSLRCPDPECRNRVAQGVSAWTGLRGNFLPVEDATDLEFSAKSTSYPLDQFSMRPVLIPQRRPQKTLDDPPPAPALPTSGTRRKLSDVVLNNQRSRPPNPKKKAKKKG